VLLIVAGLGAAAWYGTRQIHFLGIDEGGRVALYRGLPYDLPFGISLYEEQFSSPVQLSALPSDRRDEATNHELRSEDDAQSLIEDLENAASAPPPSPEPPAGGGGQGGGQAGGGGKRSGGGGGGGHAPGGGGKQGRP
jgi:hypothetical protein